MGRVSKRRLELRARLQRATMINKQNCLLRKDIQITNSFGSSGGNNSNYKVVVKQEVVDDDCEEEIEKTISTSLLTTTLPNVLPSTRINLVSWVPQQERPQPVVKPAPAPPPSNCLLCYKIMSDEKIRPVLTNSVAEASFNVMFVLKKMLQVPKSRLTEYLQTFGNPNEWILICRECLVLVDQSLRIEKEINKLEITLRKCQADMVNKIRSTWSAKTEHSVSSMFKTSPTTNEIRSFVYKRAGENLPENLTGEPYNKFLEKDGLTHSLTPSSPPNKRANETAHEDVTPGPIIIDTFCEKEEDIACSPPSPSPPSPVASSCTSDSSWEWELPDEEMEEHPSHLNDATNPDQPSSSIQPKSLPSNSKKGRRNPIYDDLCLEWNSRCSHCPNVKMTSLAMFMSHAIFHFRRPLKCSHCCLHYSSIDELAKIPRIRHMANASSQGTATKSHICTKETLVKAPAFQPGKIWKCAWCPMQFDLEEGRDLHEGQCPIKKFQSYKPEIEFKHKCATCSKMYRSLSERWTHRAMVHPEMCAKSCLYCEKVLAIQTKTGIDIPDVQAFTSHVADKHPLVSRLIHVPDSCDFCGLISPNAKALELHIQEVHQLPRMGTFSCPVCHYRQRKYRVREHIVAVHAVDKSLKRQHDRPKKIAKFIICEICGYKAYGKREKRLVDHKLTKHGIEPASSQIVYSCDREDCGGFRTLYERFLALHMMKYHQAERKHKCKVCGKGFFDLKKLQVHEEIHQNASLKPYQCEICGNSFAVRNYLYIHMRLSHQNRPFASTNKKRPRPKSSSRRNKLTSNDKLRTLLPSPSHIPLASGSGADVELDTKSTADRLASGITTNLPITTNTIA